MIEQILKFINTMTVNVDSIETGLTWQYSVPGSAATVAFDTIDDIDTTDNVGDDVDPESTLWSRTDKFWQPVCTLIVIGSSSSIII